MRARPHSCNSRLLFLASFASALILVYYRWSLLVPRGRLFQPHLHQDEHEPPCKPDLLAGLEDVFVVLKTGAADARETVPMHLATTLGCVPHYAIYSDYEEDIAGHHIHNVLSEVKDEIRSTHPDFEYYRRLQEGGREAFSREEVRQWSSAENTAAGRNSPGWKLDKWKFLPLAEKALTSRPEAKWYVILEGDSYILWDGLLDWLSRFDASKPYYLGVQMVIEDVVFAYGGAGIVISRPALEKVVEHRRVNLKWLDAYTAVHWAGDCVLGKALRDAGVELFFAWPNLFSEQPTQMDFKTALGPQYLWCYYAASYHHLASPEVLKFSKFARSHNGTEPLRHGDVFEQYILPQLQPVRADWDNLSDEHQRLGDASPTACREICVSQSDCMQFSYVQDCRTSKVIKLGKSHKESGRRRQAISGWIMNRVESFVEEMYSSCNGEGWMLP